MTPKRGQTWRVCRAAGSALLLGACGCVGFWSEITSRERDMSYVWSKPDPLVVLRDSTDNQRKAEALARLHEPLKNGGTAEQQEMYLQILTRAAVNGSEPMSRDPLCRLSAIRIMGEYKDERVVAVLEKAYLDPHPFPPEMNAMIRQQALASLEQTGNAGALPVLIRAARQPSSSSVSSQADRQSVMDEKIAAVRALGKYAHYEAVDTLVYLLETEKDVAVRHCAHQSLKTSTKRDLPADAVQWRTLLANGQPPPQETTNPIQRVTGFFSRPENTKK